MDAVRQKHEDSNDFLEGERVEEGLIRIHLSSESSSAEDPPPPSSKDGEAYQQRLLPPPALANETIERLKLESEHKGRWSCFLADLRYITNRSHLHVWPELWPSLHHERSDDGHSMGSSEEEHDIWNKVLALRCHINFGPCLQGHLTDIELERSALSSRFAPNILCRKGA